ncbi:MAG: hypothetical protein AAGC57_00370 [Pseudomonadota bacterium]
MNNRYEEMGVLNAQAPGSPLEVIAQVATMLGSNPLVFIIVLVLATAACASILSRA